MHTGRSPWGALSLGDSDPGEQPGHPHRMDAQTRARSSHPEHDTAPHVDGQEAFKTQYGCSQESRKRAGFCKGGYEMSSVTRNDFC